MNGVRYSGRFGKLSKHVSDGLNVMIPFTGMRSEDIWLMWKPLSLQIINYHDL